LIFICLLILHSICIIISLYKLTMNKTKKIGGSKKTKNKTRRNKSTKVTNASKRSDGTLIFKDYPDFRPNLTPREIFKLGSFGGTYWRPIYSSVVNKNLKNVHKKYPKVVVERYTK